ncbi:hypothetical protein BAE44_0019233 [Dichanthelium oligosanthes]|uniref:DUF1618 domain-containing protein n=1 Tax=Dichanthelium oligosanthes TaxID=888268 RepID=A0A1E5V3R3_9POAL|nr:hypothetical protein BAE44_0019233 [Dichanthelium oligosanthes]
MESLTQPGEPFDPPPAIAGADSSCPRWVMLPRYAQRRDSSVSVADAKTSAAACTSTGRTFRISFGVAVPPAISSFYYDWVGGRAPASDEYFWKPTVVATHGDCILLEMRRPCIRERGFIHMPVLDYFLYEAAAGARPPSLLLLPACYIPTLYERGCSDEARRATPRIMGENTGILRRGEDELLVVQLDLLSRHVPRGTAELCVLRHGGDDLEWKLKMVPIVHGEGSRDGQGETPTPRQWWETDAAVPVGDRFLCWVDYFRGFLLCDMAAGEGSLTLRYVPLPVVPPDKDRSTAALPHMHWKRNFSPAGAGAVRFVSIEPRCCGDLFLFTAVTTWTLSLSMDEPMTWVKDGVLACDELWALPAYEGLPRIPLEYPMVSSDDPDAICFVVGNDRRVWMIEVNMRNKVLRSVVPDNRDAKRDYYFPAKLRY